ncbi:MAG: hypothetical protein Q8M03_04780 [Legionella sp.]|nr:hypothetical protein [Legionella sp.]
MTIIKIIALLVAWVFFYKILTLRNKRLPVIKATVITLLFAALIFQVSTDMYARIDRAFFSLNKQGEVALSASPLKIPATQDVRYCHQFTDQNKQVISKISERGDGKYCGEFWQFETNQNIILPFKLINADKIIYWVSPSLRIYGPGTSSEKN